MTNMTIAWIALPFFVGFVSCLLTKCSRWLALGTALLSAGYASQVFFAPDPLNIQLLDNFGVNLLVDQLSGFFILTNALVTAAVILYCWSTNKTSFFYIQVIILHGSVNASFVCTDLISLYVALEVITIAAFLLIAYPRTDKSIWVGLRYLFISNTAMLFYLVGAILVYQAHHSFNFSGLRGAPPEAIALIFIGFLVKGGIFVSGLWLPLTYSESETSVSAMLSGIASKAAILPVLRCTLLVTEIDPMVRILGVGTAIFGVFWAIFEQDTKRTLAFSSISQFGFVIAAPVVGGLYALADGLVKSALFLIVGDLPSRNFKELREQAIDLKIWLVLVIASLSISGFPLLSGFGAKVLTTKNLLPWQVIAMNVAAFGTAITFAKFIFLPHGKSSPDENKVQTGFWWAMIILLGGLIAANGFYYQAYTPENIVKPLVTIALGWLIYLLISKNLFLKLPRGAEQLEHLLGGMSLMLVVVFWMVQV